MTSGVETGVTSGAFVLGLLQLLSALNGISLIFGSPLSHLTVGLGHASLQLSLGLLLLLKLLSEKIAVVAGRLNSVGKGVLGLMNTTGHF